MLVVSPSAPDESSVLDADVVTGCMLVEEALPGSDVVGMMSAEVEVVLCDEPESSEGAAEVPSMTGLKHSAVPAMSRAPAICRLGIHITDARSRGKAGEDVGHASHDVCVVEVTVVRRRSPATAPSGPTR